MAQNLSTESRISELLEKINEITNLVMRCARANRVVEAEGVTFWSWNDGSHATLDQAIAKVGRHPSLVFRMESLREMQREIYVLSNS